MNSTCLQTTAVVRNRFQITIPDQIRKMVNWLKPERTVLVATKTGNEVLIKPYIKETSKTDWKNIWEQISLAQSFKGKRGNLADFIAKDRYSH